MKRICLIGCGNIGSRHLQALSQLQENLLIEIVEPSERAQLIAKSRLNEIKNNSNHKFLWHRSISQLKNKSDLTIVATNSKNRVNLIEKILKLGHKRLLVEKIVCQSIREYKKLIILMKKFNAKGWVNTNRRYFKSYQNIMKKFKKSNQINISVFSKGTALGTNAIHFLDLFCWLTHENKIKLYGDFISNRLLKNKRDPMLIEFSGCIIGFNKNGCCISINFSNFGKESHQVKISDDKQIIIINELSGDGYLIDNNGKNHFKFEYEYVSNLSVKIVNDIIKNDKCLLPSISDSYHIHIELFKIFNQHLKKILKRNIRLCPIT